MFIGEKLDKGGLQKEFDECLLTASEMKKWERIMGSKRSADAVQEKLEKAFEGEQKLISLSPNILYTDCRFFRWIRGLAGSKRDSR